MNKSLDGFVAYFRAVIFRYNAESFKLKPQKLIEGSETDEDANFFGLLSSAELSDHDLCYHLSSEQFLGANGRLVVSHLQLLSDTGALWRDHGLLDRHRWKTAKTLRC